MIYYKGEYYSFILRKLWKKGKKILFYYLKMQKYKLPIDYHLMIILNPYLKFKKMTNIKLLKNQINVIIRIKKFLKIIKSGK